MTTMSTDQERRIEYLRLLAFEPDKPLVPYASWQAPAGNAFRQIARLELEKRGEKTLPLAAEDIRASLKRMNDRLDCADFDLTALVRMLYRYPQSNLLNNTLREEMRREMLRFTYWVDEPGCSNMIFSTENHQIIYHVDELLVGSLWPDDIFGNNGETGRWHAQHAQRHITKWLDWRIRFGFSEWNSNCYFEEDLIALLNLSEFAPDETTRTKARRVIDLIMLHLAVNSFDGAFGSPHGRTYARMLLNPLNENTRPLAWMAFGMGSLSNYRMGATLLACSDYAVPEIIAKIAQDTGSVIENRECHSLNVEEARDHDIYPELMSDLMFFWGCQNFHHRDIIDASMAFCPSEHRVEYPKIEAAYTYYHNSEERGLPWVPTRDHQGMSQVNIYTYRTPSYMLSCAQDFRKGEFGWQAHIWQATLGDRAVVYTTHPGAEDTGTSRPDYWHGNDIMPRAVAYKNTAICLYRSTPPVNPADKINPLPAILERTTGLDMTHAFFPKYAFDEIREQDGWVMGRAGQAYVGLWSLVPAQWAEPQDEVVALLPIEPDETVTPYELIAAGRTNAWICELGDAETYDDFDAFCAALATTQPAGDTEILSYTSPSSGEITFGWENNLIVDGQVIDLGPYPRIDNRFCSVPFDNPNVPTEYDIKYIDSRYRI